MVLLGFWAMMSCIVVQFSYKKAHGLKVHLYLFISFGVVLLQKSKVDLSNKVIDIDVLPYIMSYCLVIQK